MEERYREASDTAAKSHNQAIWLIAKGRSIGEVAEILGFVPRWIADSAVQRGPDALGDLRRHNGRAPTVLTAEIPAALDAIASPSSCSTIPAGTAPAA